MSRTSKVILGIIGLLVCAGIATAIDINAPEIKQLSFVVDIIGGLFLVWGILG